MSQNLKGMHFSTSDSYTFVSENLIRFTEEYTPSFFDEEQQQSKEVKWGFLAINTLIPIFARMFPQYNVLYVIENDDNPNAWVCPLENSQFLIAVNDGAINAFVKKGNVFFNSYKEIIDTEEELAILEVLSKMRDIEPLGNITAQLYGCCALAATIGHELGHVHEGQFEVAAPVSHPVLINHGTEFSADTWSVWVAAFLADPFIEISREVAYETHQLLACNLLQSTIVLSAFCCIDEISFEQPWTPNNLNDNSDTHPQALARLLAASVSLLDWWVKQKGLSLEYAAPIVIKALSRILKGIAQDQSGLETDSLLETLLAHYDQSASYIANTMMHYSDWIGHTVEDSESEEKEVI